MERLFVYWFLFGIVPFVPFVPIVSLFKKHIGILNTWRKVLKPGTKGTIGTKIRFFRKFSRFFSGIFKLFLRESNFLKLLIKGRENRELENHLFIYIVERRIDFYLEFLRLPRLSAFLKIYKKFEFSEKSFEIWDKRDNRDNRIIFGKLTSFCLRHATLTIMVRSSRQPKS